MHSRGIPPQARTAGQDAPPGKEKTMTRVILPTAGAFVALMSLWGVVGAVV